MTTQRAQLFVTCMVNLFRPRVGAAAVRVLERRRVEVETLLERFTRRVRNLAGSVWLASGGRDDVRQALTAAIDELAPARSDGRPRHVVAWAVDDLAPLELPALLAGLDIEYVRVVIGDW